MTTTENEHTEEGGIAFRHYNDMPDGQHVCTTCGALVRHGFRGRHAGWHRGENQQTDVIPTDEVI